jgi:DNA-binding NarL/FixJ family response regulator
MRTSMRLLLVDDHAFVRMGLRRFLSRHEDLEVVGEAGSAREARALVEQLDPGLLIVDLMLPDSSGVALAMELRERTPALKAILLSGVATRDSVVRALAAGVAGYVLKDQPPEHLLQAIRHVAAGGTHFPPSVMQLVGEAARAEQQGSLHTLSRREREVFDLLVRGVSNEDIAARLFISARTVETHRSHIYEKLRLHSIADLVRFAALHGELMR